MSFLKSLLREAKFMMQDRSQILALMLVFILSCVSVVGGLLEANHQKATIERLQSADKKERLEILSKQESWGGAAYYSFHLTFAPPEPFAFAAMGQRDSQPWKHRIRMLALEGQIYERDSSNPVLALIGRFDFSFFSAFVLPFILIILLHDLRSSERKAGRYNLLMATGSVSHLWAARTSIRALSLYIMAVIPLIVASVVNNVEITIIIRACIYLALYLLFWSIIIFCSAIWKKASSIILASLIGFWSLVAVIIPTGGRIAIDKFIDLPSGSEILMMQRETVNDAWDLPKEVTMTEFLKRYPEWANYADVKRPFEWKWYYAFQQVGDQKTEELSNAYREGRLNRDRMAAYLAMLAPPALLERALQELAGTDTISSLAYEEEVRKFHSDLRYYYYPKLFMEKPFDNKLLSELPEFSPSNNK